MVIDSPSDFHHKAYHKADYEYARMRTTIERIRDIRLQLLDFIIMYIFHSLENQSQMWKWI